MNNQQLLLMLSAKIIELATAQSETQEKQISKEIEDINQQINAAKPEGKKEEVKSVFLKFTEKEISKMPTRFKKEIRINGCTVHCRKRKSGVKINYELRYRRNGYNIQVSSNDLEVAKQKFIDKINSIENNTTDKSSIPTTFTSFALYHFEKYRKRKVAEITYKNDLSRLKNYIIPFFGEIEIKKITPDKCQELIDNIDKLGYQKTKEEVYSLMNIIFKSAIAHNIISKNPTDIVFMQKHEKKHGTALTKEEEKKLLKETAGTRYQTLYAVILYTGLRPDEYKTAIIKDKFIIAENKKRKTKNKEYKKIPITKMLSKYLKGITELNFPRKEYMRDKMKTILPNHILYDLRTTFYTRCQECGISEVAIKKYVGHTLGGLADTYTDISDEFLLKEAEKFNY